MIIASVDPACMQLQCEPVIYCGGLCTAIFYHHVNVYATPIDWCMQRAEAIERIEILTPENYLLYSFMVDSRSY